MSNPYGLLKPTKSAKPSKEAVQIITPQTRTEVRSLISNLEDLVAVDIETKGNKVHDPTSYVVGLGVADSKTILYFNLKECHESIYQELLIQLQTKILFGFNINFDAGYLHRDLSLILGQPFSGANLKWHDWKYDVYGLYKQLANEGWPGQEWNLKSAQIDLIGWETKGNVELGQWLVDNDHYTTTSIEKKADHYYRIVHNAVEGDVPRWCKPDYSKMYLAPSEILGYYCGLDAASTYILLTEVFIPAVERLPSFAQTNFWYYHQDLFITNVKWHIEQQLRGLKVNTEALIEYTKVLEQEIKQAEKDFFNHPDIKPHVDLYNQEIIQAYKTKEPPQYVKSGAISKNWLKWSEKYNEIKSTNHFNLNSGRQRAWLFYDRLEYPVILRTDKGNPAVDKKALLAWGEPGKILKMNNDKVKELGYVQACIEQVNTAADGLLHLQFRLPGTLTCRTAGAGNFSCQQQPKSKRYLQEWKPREGMVWIDVDIESLEAVVLAELSQDKTMQYLYDPKNPKQDIYLYVGSFLPKIGDAIKKAGYNPDTPTPEGIASAKKLAKKERQIAKTCVLGFQYGMGPKKLRQSLALEGVKLTEDEAYEIYCAYWDLFGGIKEYTKHLEAEWRKRGGWFYNGIGRPITCYEPFLRDITNRCVQSTGHDVLMYINYQLYQLREETQVEFYPIIIDWHDASLVECAEENSTRVLEIFNEAYRRTNDWLKGTLEIRTKPQIVHNLAQSKCEG